MTKQQEIEMSSFVKRMQNTIIATAATCIISILAGGFVFWKNTSVDISNIKYWQVIHQKAHDDERNDNKEWRNQIKKDIEDIKTTVEKK